MHLLIFPFTLRRIWRKLLGLSSKSIKIIQEPVILGPQLGDNGQFYFRVSITVQSGTQSTVYHQFYRLYHDALLKGGIDLPTIYTLA